MAYSEIDVINKIRESKDPDRALQIVMKITLDYLAQTESAQAESPSALPGICATT
jgi:hypothetical protein